MRRVTCGWRPSPPKWPSPTRSPRRNPSSNSPVRTARFAVTPPLSGPSCFTVKFPVKPAGRGGCSTWNVRRARRNTWSAGRRRRASSGRERPAAGSGRTPKTRSRPPGADERGRGTARGRERARRVTVSAGSPSYASWRARTTSTRDAAPAARAASRRNAHRFARGSRSTCSGRPGRGRGRAPGEPLPDPTSTRSPGPDERQGREDGATRSRDALARRCARR